MDKRYKKLYDKAMGYYEKGKLNKALDICETALSESLKNSEILNLKGLLLYQKGDLNEAITVWKINKDFNDDSMSKNYIKDVESDKERLKLYKAGEFELKQLRIDHAIEILKKCAESDFNAIKVNSALALCYQKKGEFKEAYYYVNKVLSIDNNSGTAKKIKNELKEIGAFEEKCNYSKKVVMTISGAIVIIVIGFGGYIAIKKEKETRLNNNYGKIEQINQDSQQDDNSDIEKNEIDTKNNYDDAVQNQQEDNLKTFDKQKLSVSIANKDVDEIYKDIKDKNIKQEDRDIYNQAVSLLKGAGVEKFYEYGLWYFNEKNYENAQTEFDKAYEYCDGSYLKEHIKYYRASTLLQRGKNSGALKEYEEYYNEYQKGSYTEEALYQLALLNRDIDREKSKKYANILTRDYSKSMYINDYIVNIINN